MDDVAYVTLKDDVAELRMELGGGERLYHTTLTIHVLAEALSYAIDGEEHSNRIQQADIDSRCVRGEGYGHALGGYVSSRVMSWLREQGKLSSETALAPPEIALAMRQAFKAVTLRKFHKLAKSCEAVITTDGRFMLSCIGNACDLSIYPDNMTHEIDEFGVRVSCHNLDSPDQQITLLAGFVKLCELARQSEET